MSAHDSSKGARRGKGEPISRFKVYTKAQLEEGLEIGDAKDFVDLGMPFIVIKDRRQWFDGGEVIDWMKRWSEERKKTK